MLGRNLIGSVAAALSAMLVLTACGDRIESTPEAPETECGTVRIAVNPWVGYEANAAVVSYVLTNRLGCTVELKDLTSEVSWQGFATGEVDVILENWGHDDLKKNYIDNQKVAVQMGVTGNEGIIGWYVPPWMAEEYPDITSWENLNQYAELFRTSESGDKGQLLDGDPSYVTFDEALVENLDLDFKVVYAGTENALIEAFQAAEENRTPLLGYFYEPQWFLLEVRLVQVKLPAYTPGCDADPAKVACDYQPYDLDMIASKEFAESGSPAVEVIKNFTWTNDDQNSVARDIANRMPYDEAAEKWVNANPETVEAWLAGTNG